MSNEIQSPGSVQSRKRRILLTATAGMAGLGGLLAAVPFAASWMPSQRARSAGAPERVDISRLEPGQQLTVKWRGRPVWILRRTTKMLARMEVDDHLKKLRDPDSNVTSQQPDYAHNADRALISEYFVVIGVCTHLGCVPSFRPDIAPSDLGADWDGGYFCPCHGSRFDLAGRVYKGVPAPTNLVVPPYRFLRHMTIEVGVDPERV